MKQRPDHHHVERAHGQRDEENDEHGRVKSTIAFLNSCHLATSRWGIGYVRARIDFAPWDAQKRPILATNWVRRNRINIDQPLQQGSVQNQVFEKRQVP